MSNHTRDESSLEKSETREVVQLKRWRDEGATVWVYAAAHNGAVSSAMYARITEVSRCLVVNSDTGVMRFDLQNVKFAYGPLKVLLTPTHIGRAVAVTHSREGLVNSDGVIIVMDAGFSLFICDRQHAPSTVTELMASTLTPGGRLLGS